MRVLLAFVLLLGLSVLATKEVSATMRLEISYKFVIFHSRKKLKL